MAHAPALTSFVSISGERTPITHQSPIHDPITVVGMATAKRVQDALSSVDDWACKMLDPNVKASEMSQCFAPDALFDGTLATQVGVINPSNPLEGQPDVLTNYMLQFRPVTHISFKDVHVRCATNTSIVMGKYTFDKPGDISKVATFSFTVDATQGNKLTHHTSALYIPSIDTSKPITHSI